ncbi:SDR family oxidoreductase [Streptomyces sp. TLI_171]|uniref:SDR family NAD(P)-dependent oxidoreductase n=1 Tax=Streptomyces sp. TLI_171 TaxID=1938859 RepID=UPI000C18D281|nr:SDR family oxidoreductase [Streptomyces sp. TLI_171]RKE23495.1 short-subunit dehydrogenase [Streptomyces sp. TLI_171]
MDATDARLLVVGATGELGSRIAARAAQQGALVVPAGRDTERLAAIGRRLRAPRTLAFDAYDLERCTALAAEAAARLGGLDAVLVAVGSAAFARAEDSSAEIDEHLFTVNTLAPIAVLRGALRVLGDGGAVGAVTGIVVERPTATAGAYGASKSALAGWLDTVRVEQRRNRVTVLDARPPHLRTGFAERAVAGRPPRLPAGSDPGPWADAILDGLLGGASLVRPDPEDVGRPVVVGAARPVAG